jgi:hypothetical protein
MLTQRARARAEIGDVAPARQDAAAALRALVGDPDDVTASAIGAAAAELLFQTAPWGQESLDQLITAIDTALSWWRTQTVSTALRAAADRTPANGVTTGQPRGSTSKTPSMTGCLPPWSAPI